MNKNIEIFHQKLIRNRMVFLILGTLLFGLCVIKVGIFLAVGMFIGGMSLGLSLMGWIIKYEKSSTSDE